MKKFLATLAIFSVIFSSFSALLVRPAHAQLVGPWYDQTFPQWFTKVYEDSNPQEIFGERYTAAQVQWIIYSLASYLLPTKRIAACLMGVVDISGCQSEFLRILAPLSDSEPMSDRPIAERINDASVGLASIAIQDRQISGIGHIRSSIASAGVPEIYAQDTQGTGFRGLGSVRSLWQASRDVTYVLMVLVIIAMAFMIMFRMQLPSRTVISVQSSLWNVFIALILITFSYAIAGFAIDLMYISIGLVSIIFTQTSVLVVPSGANATFAIYSALTSGPNNLGAAGFLLAYLQNFFSVFTYILNSPGDLWDAAFIFAAGISRDMLVATATLILSIIMIVIFFQIMWMLIKTFVNILLLTITGPFQILIGAAYPGTGGFKGWFMNLLTNLAVYPAVGVLFLMAYVFLSGAYYVDRNSANSILSLFAGSGPVQFSGFGFSVSDNLFTGAGTNSWTPPMTVGGYISFLWLFASFVCVSMTPKTVELIQSFMSGKPFAYGSALGQAVGAAGVGFVAGQVKGAAGDMTKAAFGRGFAMIMPGGTRTGGGTTKGQRVGSNPSTPTMGG